MQITYLGKEKFEIKTKDAVIALSDNINIDGFEISGPGEYERKGVFVQAIKPNGDGCVFVLHAEAMAICYGGRLKAMISDEAIKEIGDIDILILPLGEDGTLDMKDASALIAKIDPRTVIPMLYSDISEFKKTEGIVEEDIDTLKIKKLDLPDEERKFFILRPKP
ncbi:MAG: MBL fold metallo-hydrolase [Patescibacteria group bacterium]|jgi:L-ascorbate metabolism protein UlaG (beta-lactamase superfamily)